MRTHSTRRPRGDTGSFWISYSDLMAGMLFVFALILFFSIYQLVELQETKTAELETKEAQLTQQQSILLDQQAELQDKEAQLAASTALLDDQQAQLDEQAALLALSTTQLEEKQAAFDAQSLELDDAKKKIALAQENMAAQQIRMNEQEALLSAQQTKIDNLIGVRSRIIEDLRDEMLSANLNTVVDRQTGAIVFTGSVLFDSGKSELKPSGMALLDSFLPVYVRTLLSPENSEYVAEIIIEGHTDTDGDYLSNLNLSQQRALSVVTYCLSDAFGGLTHAEKEQLRSIMTANGRSYVDPVYYEDGTINKDASRRVEFKFRLKDAEMIDEMSRILEAAD